MFSKWDGCKDIIKYEEQGKQFPDELLLKSLEFTQDIQDKTIRILKHKEFWGETNKEILMKVTDVLTEKVNDYIKNKIS